MSLPFLTFPKSGAGADVRVRVHARVVQVQREHARDGTVVRVGTTDRQPVSTRTPIAVTGKCFDPTAYHPADFVVQA